MISEITFSIGIMILFLILLYFYNKQPKSNKVNTKGFSLEAILSFLKILFNVNRFDFKSKSFDNYNKFSKDVATNVLAFAKKCIYALTSFILKQQILLLNIISLLLEYTCIIFITLMSLICNITFRTILFVIKHYKFVSAFLSIYISIISLRNYTKLLNNIIQIITYMKYVIT